MWEPSPSWRRLDARGRGSDGMWLAEEGGRSWVVKRLPAPDEAGGWARRADHVAYWRREAEVARAPEVVGGPGLVPPVFGLVEEDDEGVVLRTAQTSGEPPTGLFAARALGRFAAAPHLTPSWAARRQLADRLAMADRRGGWPTLARTTLADVTDHLWRRRQHWLDACDDGPTGRVHGDPVPGNLLAVRGADVVAVDWQCFGVGPVGSDLGYFALSCREELEVLLDAFVDGVRAETSDPAAVDVEAITRAARVSAVYTVVTRAEWALAGAAAGEGALAGKLHHPAVVPHLRALQRQLPQVEALVGT